MRKKRAGGFSAGTAEGRLHLESEAQAEPGEATTFCFVRPHRARVKEYPHMRAEAIFHAGTRLAKPKFPLIELVTATAKGVGSESTLPQRETQD
jgi:hypothetical protein